jgi:hypothetical protein
MKWIRLTAICLIAVVIIAAAGFYWLGFGLCGHKVTQLALSPSGRYTAKIEEFDCGAVSGWDSDVMILQRPFLFSSRLFGTASEIFYLNGAPSNISLRWSSDSELTLQCFNCQTNQTKILKKRWKEITIQYIISP